MPTESGELTISAGVNYTCNVKKKKKTSSFERDELSAENYNFRCDIEKFPYFIRHHMFTLTQPQRAMIGQFILL